MKKMNYGQAVGVVLVLAGVVSFMFPIIVLLVFVVMGVVCFQYADIINLQLDRIYGAKITVDTLTETIGSMPVEKKEDGRVI